MRPPAALVATRPEPSATSLDVIGRVFFMRQILSLKQPDSRSGARDDWGPPTVHLPAISALYSLGPSRRRPVSSQPLAPGVGQARRTPPSWRAMAAPVGSVVTQVRYRLDLADAPRGLGEAPGGAERHICACGRLFLHDMHPFRHTSRLIRDRPIRSPGKGISELYRAYFLAACRPRIRSGPAAGPASARR
jgi:hypothetical protein